MSDTYYLSFSTFLNFQKTQKELKKRDLTLVDQSKGEICLTLWNAHAESFDPGHDDYPVVAVKGAKVTDFNGVSLGTWASTIVQV